MWETDVQTSISEIIVNLHHEKPDFRAMASKVNALAAEVGMENLPRQIEPGAPTPMINQRACEVWAELESLEAAISERNVPKALEHAEVALRLFGSGSAIPQKRSLS